MPLNMFGASSTVIATLHLPDSALSVAHASGANWAARDAGVKKPTLIGGGVTADNLREVLPTGDGAIASGSRSRKGIDSDDPLRMNADPCRRLMDQARDA